MIDVKTGWNRPYRPLQGDHGAALMVELQAAQGAGKVPVDVHLVLDISGSMKQHNKLDEAKKTCRFVSDSLEEKDTLTLTAFNDNANDLLRDAPVNAHTRRTLREQLDQLKPAGVTRLDQAFERILQRPGDASKGSRFVILISDGQPTDARGTQIKDPAEHLRLAERIGKSGVRLISVALGDPQAYDAAFFNSVAERTQGPFRFSPRAEGLKDALAQDIRAIINTAVEDVSLSFSFANASTRLLWMGRAYPDKQFLEPVALSDARYHLGGLSVGEAHTFVAYILTSGDLDTTPGAQAIGNVTIGCRGPAGDWKERHDLTLEYTDRQDLLEFLDAGVERWRLEMEETSHTMKAVNAKASGNQKQFEQHLRAAKRTREELGKQGGILDTYRDTRPENAADVLANVLAEARKSRRDK